MRARSGWASRALARSGSAAGGGKAGGVGAGVGRESAAGIMSRLLRTGIRMCKAGVGLRLLFMGCLRGYRVVIMFAGAFCVLPGVCRLRIVSCVEAGAGAYRINRLGKAASSSLDSYSGEKVVPRAQRIKDREVYENMKKQNVFLFPSLARNGKH